MIIIIINRLRSWYQSQLLDQQQGFRSGRGTAGGIYITKRIQQITDKMKRPWGSIEEVHNGGQNGGL